MGFTVIDILAKNYSIDTGRKKFRSQYGEGRICGFKAVLIKPLAYMNLSGECVRDAMIFYKVGPENLIIVYDDADLTPGEIRVRERGSAGSHNGMKNIILNLGTDEIKRVRVGIGSSRRVPLRDFVLGKIKNEEADLLSEGASKAAEAVKMLMTEGAAAAMNMFNKRIESVKGADS